MSLFVVKRHFSICIVLSYLSLLNTKACYSASAQTAKNVAGSYKTQKEPPNSYNFTTL